MGYAFAYFHWRAGFIRRGGSFDASGRLEHAYRMSFSIGCR